MNGPSPSNVKIKIIPDPNPWEHAEQLPRMPLPGVIVLSFAAVCGASFPAIMGKLPFLWLPVLLICALCLLRTVRGVYPLLLSAAVFAVGSFIGGAAFGTALFGILCALALSAFLITVVRSPWLMLLPVIAYGLSWALGGSYAIALFSLLPLPAALLLAHGIMKNDTRVSVICSTAAALLVCTLVAIAAWWYEMFGSLDMSSLKETAEQFRTELVAAMLALPQTDALIAAMNAQGAEVTPELLGEAFSLTIELFLRISPALFVVAGTTLAYAAQLICVKSYSGCGMPRLVTRTQQLFVLSVPSALIFLFCGAATLFSSGTTLFSTVVVNLYLILLPGMCIVGFWKTMSDLHRRPSRLAIVIILGLAIMIPVFLIISIALIGALASLTRPLIARILANGALSDGDDGTNDKKE